MGQVSLPELCRISVRVSSVTGPGERLPLMHLPAVVDGIPGLSVIFQPSFSISRALGLGLIPLYFSTAPAGAGACQCFP